MITNNYIFNCWDDECLNLRIPVLRGIYAYGFEKPSPIQSRAIIPILKKRDIIAQAQSGTGKSGAFVIGSLQMKDETIPETQVVIMKLFNYVASVSNKRAYVYNVLECMITLDQTET